MRKMLIGLGSAVGLLVVAALGLFYSATRHEVALTEVLRKSLPGQYVATPTGTLRYDWRGPEDGPVLVMVHGYSTPSFVFNKNVPALVKAGFRVLTYDHFGRGYSDRPAAARYDADFFDSELTGLLDALNVNAPVRLLGYSMGGGVAAVFAARHPERVAKLALIAPVGYMPPPAGSEALLHLPVLGDWLFALVGKSTLVGQFESDAKLGDYTPDMPPLFAEQWNYAGTRDALLSSARYFPYGGLAPEYKKIGKAITPTLMIWGTADQTVPFEGAARMKADVPQAHLLVMQDGTHNVLLNRADAVNKAVAEFFR
jgi:pimeloyl-ACP methyl ester carboxylesterase